MSLESFEAVARVIAGLFALIGLPVLVWVASTLRDLVLTQRKHDQTLYGVKGDNGIQSDVLRLRTARHEHGNNLQAHEFRLDDHDRRIERLEIP